MAVFFEQYLVIDYGTTHIKGILYQVTPGGKRILRVESLPMVTLQESDAPTVETESIGEYEYNIVRFVQSFFPEEQNCVVNLPVSRAYVRDLVVPITNTKQIQEVIPFEVEQHIPVSLDQAEVLGHAWDVGEESSQVITFTAPHESLEAAVQPFLKGNVIVRMLSLDCVGLAGVAQLLQPDEVRDRVIAQLDIGGMQTILNVLVGGELVFTRTIPIGGHDVTLAIAETLSIDAVSAEQKKIALGLDLVSAVEKSEAFFRRNRLTPADYKKVLQASKRVFQDLADELERSVLSLPSSDPVVYYLSGGGSQIAGTAQFLEDRLEARVAPYPLEMSGEESLANWATALGTGEHYRLKTQDRIDFLRSPFGNTLRQGEFNFNIFATPVLLGITSVIILLASFLVSIWSDNRQIREYRAQIETVARQIPGMKADGGTTAMVALAKRLCAQKLASQQGQGEGASVLDLMKDLSDKTPGRDEMFFQLKRFSYAGTDIQFDADLDGYDKIQKLKESLSKSAFFSDVQVTRQNKILNDKVRVSMKLTVKAEAKGSSRRCN